MFEGLIVAMFVSNTIFCFFGRNYFVGIKKEKKEKISCEKKKNREGWRGEAIFVILFLF